MQLLEFLNVKGELAREYPHALSDEDLVKGYKTMVLTRHVDERMVTLQRQGTISFAMSSLGEEASVVASAAALKMEDWIYPQYRESGCIFWRGLSIQDYVHHMFCNAKDMVKGRQMPNHFGSRELNVVTISSPIATQLPHAAGCAYAMKLEGADAVALTYFGEGATSEGDFHAALNFAAVRKAPVIFFCRNNGWAISTPAEEQFASDGVAVKAPGYGMRGMRVDGNDYFAVHAAVTEAREHCVGGHGPVLIEAVTYRRGAHSTSDDPTGYREEAEVKEAEKSDPVERLRKYLESRKLWSARKEAAWLKEVKEQVDSAIRIAKEEPPPSLESLFEDVYATVPEALRQQYEMVKRFHEEED